MSATTTAVSPVQALAKQAAHCSEMCQKENRPACAAICRDTAELATLLANFLGRDAHGTAALSDAAVELFNACASECEQHDAQHCRDTAKLAREAIAAVGGQAKTTPRTPSGERL